jgi:hypothetical protein
MPTWSAWLLLALGMWFASSVVVAFAFARILSWRNRPATQARHCDFPTVPTVWLSSRSGSRESMLSGQAAARRAAPIVYLRVEAR